VIVGRDHELEQLGGLVGGLDGPSVLLLEGEAGIGKTTIWEAGLEAAAAAPARVLTARAAQAEMPLAFTSIADLLCDVLDELLPALPEPQRDALSVALLLTPPRRGTPDSRAVATAFLGALRALAKTGPVVVAVDDVQWLDPPSAATLAFALRRIRAEPVGFLLTRRTPSPQPLGLDRPPPQVDMTRQTVGPLSLAALQRLLRMRLGEVLPRPALRRLHATAGGNPFFALELARALSGRWAELGPGQPLPVPEELHALLRERLTGLSETTLDALLHAALLTEPAVDRLAPSLRDALDPALRAGVVSLRAGRLSFTHPLLASSLVDLTDAGRLRALHAELAEQAATPEVRARHLALATDAPDERVAAELIRASRVVASRGAPATAAELAEQASRLTPAASRETAATRAIDAGLYAWAAGDAARAEALLGGATADVHGPVRAQALVQLARLRVHAGDRRSAAAVYARAEEEAGDDPRLLAQVHEGLAWCLFLTREDVPGAAHHARRAVELAEAIGDDVLLGDALSVQAQSEFFQGGGLPSAAMERALAIQPDDTADVRVLRQPRMHWAVLLQCVDRFDEARELLGQVQASATAAGDDSAGPWVLMRLALVELLAGRWDEAAELAESGYELALETHQLPLATMLLCARALVYAHQGRGDEARAAAAEGLADAVPLGDGIGVSLGRWALGLAALTEGEPTLAVRELEGLHAATEAAGITEPGAARWIGDLIEALIGVERFDEASALTAQLEERGAALERDWALAVAGRCRGLLAAADGDLDAALAALEEAASLHERVPVPFDRARTLLVLGTVRRRARRRRDAREALVEACAELERLGAQPWLERGQAEMRRLGGRAPSDGKLTPSERKVAALVAQGRTNREVAAELVLSEKTVESHLSHVYRKLGVRSRSELAHQMGGGSDPLSEVDSRGLTPD
jgi:DNA-binding CsgD family transcriptional regulator